MMQEKRQDHALWRDSTKGKEEEERVKLLHDAIGKVGKGQRKVSNPHQQRRGLTGPGLSIAALMIILLLWSLNGKESSQETTSPFITAISPELASSSSSVSTSTDADNRISNIYHVHHIKLYDQDMEIWQHAYEHQHLVRPCGARSMNEDDDNWPNHIVYDTSLRPAGLADRLRLIQILAELAAFTCATVYMPPPSFMLSPHHNDGRFVDEELQWSDFYTFATWDGRPIPVFSSTPPPLNQSNFDDTTTTMTQLHTMNHSESVQNEMDQIMHKLNHKEQTWRWTISCGFWMCLHSPVVSIFKKLQKTEPNKPMYLPFTGKLLYSHQSVASRVQTAAEELAQRLLKEVFGSTSYNDIIDSFVLGSWHIRRGDSSKYGL